MPVQDREEVGSCGESHRVWGGGKGIDDLGEDKEKSPEVSPHRSAKKRPS